MIVGTRSAGVRRWWIMTVALGCSVGVLSQNLRADNHFYVLRDGSKVALHKSSHELGILLPSHKSMAKAKLRLEKKGRRLVNLSQAPQGRMKILRLGKGEKLSDVRIDQDASIQQYGAVYRFDHSQVPVFASGRLVLKFHAAVDAGDRKQFWIDHNLNLIAEFPRLHDVYIVRSNLENVDDAVIALQLADDDRTVWANPDFHRFTTTNQVIPDDEFFPFQWHLHNTGQGVGTVDADIDAPEAWTTATGAGVLFGMFDDSCDVEHEDLRDNYIGIGQDLALPIFDPDVDNPGPKDPIDAHGTAVMGLAVASGNTLGVRGVSFDSTFTATRGLLEFSTTDSLIALAYSFAMEQNVDIHINSWGFVGSPPNPPIVVEAIDTAFREGRDPDGPGGLEPLGMIIFFASGNENTEIIPGFELALLPQVVGIGASTDTDLRASFSNWGLGVNIMAPGGGSILLGITTTDTEDRFDRFPQGYNFGGTGVFPGTNIARGPDIDPAGGYTAFFGGTSAACPIAAGVAGLVLSVNPSLTAHEVRTLLEHSTEQINPGVAAYDGITGRSIQYGYGRINAALAVAAATTSLNNGGNTWPDTPQNVSIDGNVLTWTAGDATDEFLVFETTGTFDLVPAESSCFDASQIGCSGTTLQDLPTGASVLFTGCNGSCSTGTVHSVTFERPLLGSKLIAIYGRNVTTGRYSFGQAVEAQSAQPPSVTITALPLTGMSPLTVQFNGNAVSELPIDMSGIEWDFDATNLFKDNITVNAFTQAESFTYFVTPGVTETFTARLSMRDIDGTVGVSDVKITVVGQTIMDTGSETGNDIDIVVGLPGSPGSNVASGESPLSVELRIVANTPANIQSVDWDLGDGSTAQGLVVAHTYTHGDNTSRTFAINATIRTVSIVGAVTSETATTFLTVDAGTQAIDPGDPNLPGTTPLGSGGLATPCGLIGMVPMLAMLLALTLIRRRRK